MRQGHEEVVLAGKESAAGMDQWSPGDLELMSPMAFDMLAIFSNMVDDGGKWPMQYRNARAIFLSKGEEEDLDALGYRALLMLNTTYRTWAKVRLRQLEQWINTWVVDEIMLE